MKAARHRLGCRLPGCVALKIVLLPGAMSASDGELARQKAIVDIDSSMGWSADLDV